MIRSLRFRARPITASLAAVSLTFLSVWVGASGKTEAVTGIATFSLEKQEQTFSAQPFNNWHPAWSPDGTKIAFHSDRDGDDEIFIMNADGSGQKRLTFSPGRDAHPSFSPDGRKIVFQSPRAGGGDQREVDIYVMNIDGSEQTRLTHNPGFDGVPVWSPDGRKIAFQSKPPGPWDEMRWQIHVMNADGTGQVQLTHDDADNQVPNWSPDGSKLVFFANKSRGTNHIYLIDADGSNVRQLTAHPERDDYGPAFSPDGQRMAFMAGAPGAGDIYVMNADGSNPARLTTNLQGHGIPFWSPDGRRLLVNSHRDGMRDIYVLHADGSNLQRLTYGSVGRSSAAVLLVAFSGEHQVGLFDPATYKLLATLPTGKGPHEIATSADGRYAAVAISGTGPEEPGHALTLVDLQNHTLKATFDLGSYTGSHDVRLSRDNGIVWVACALAQAVLELDTSTGEVLHVWKTERNGGWFLSVTPDEKKIFVPHLEGKGVSIINRAARTVQTLPLSAGQAGLDISPDGREVWVSDAEHGTITVIDTAAERVMASFASGGPGFGRLRFTPDGQRVVLVQREEFSVFDAATRQKVGGLKLRWPAKVVTVSPAGYHAFVTHPSVNQVTVVDLRTLTIIAAFPTGETPDGIAWAQRTQSRH